MARVLKVRLDKDLHLINALALALIGVVTLLPDIPLRVALGTPFVLFFPGYTLISALFPKKKDLNSIERVALSLGLSLAVVPLIGLGLNYIPFGIRLQPVLALFSFRLVPSISMTLPY
jgi:uncharacterized membrane protein